MAHGQRWHGTFTWQSTDLLQNTFPFDFLSFEFNWTLQHLSMKKDWRNDHKQRYLWDVLSFPLQIPFRHFDTRFAECSSSTPLARHVLWLLGSSGPGWCVFQLTWYVCGWFAQIHMKNHCPLSSHSPAVGQAQPWREKRVSSLPQRISFGLWGLSAGPVGRKN